MGKYTEILPVLQAQPPEWCVFAQRFLPFSPFEQSVAPLVRHIAHFENPVARRTATPKFVATPDQSIDHWTQLTCISSTGFAAFVYFRFIELRADCLLG